MVKGLPKYVLDSGLWLMIRARKEAKSDLKFSSREWEHGAMLKFKGKVSIDNACMEANKTTSARGWLAARVLSRLQ